MVLANCDKLPLFISLTAETKFEVAVVVRFDVTPTSKSIFEKLLSTSKLVSGDPFAILRTRVAIKLSF